MVDGGGDAGVGHGGQPAGRIAGVEDAGEIGERRDEGELALGDPQSCHHLGFAGQRSVVLAAPGIARIRNEPVQQRFDRLLQRQRQRRRIEHGHVAQIGRKGERCRDEGFERAFGCQQIGNRRLVLGGILEQRDDRLLFRQVERADHPVRDLGQPFRRRLVHRQPPRAPFARSFLANLAVPWEVRRYGRQRPCSPSGCGCSPAQVFFEWVGDLAEGTACLRPSGRERPCWRSGRARRRLPGSCRKAPAARHAAP